MLGLHPILTAATSRELKASILAWVPTKQGLQHVLAQQLPIQTRSLATHLRCDLG